jgi:alkanesulfonate monooxygenase SsuD/methylene tetrahydromethanopterin reductase-like flavin-dependent oxidoreductase (luciferase family)
MDVFEQKLAALHGHCRTLGRDPKSVRVSVERTCAIFKNDAERQAYIARWWKGARPDRVEGFFEESCVGTADEVTKELAFYVERGAELVILWFQDLADVGSGDSQPERFMREVAPRLRNLH